MIETLAGRAITQQMQLKINNAIWMSCLIEGGVGGESLVVVLLPTLAVGKSNRSKTQQ